MLRLLLILALAFTTYISSAQKYKLETTIQKGHFAAVKTVAIDEQGKLLASGSRDKTAKLWDLATGKEIRTFLGHEHTVTGIKFSKDSKKLITSSADGSARIWDVFTGKQLYATRADEKLLTDVALSPDEKYLLTAGYSDQIKIWDLTKDSIVNTIDVNSDQGSGYGISLQYSQDGKYLIVGEDDRTAKVYDGINYKLIHTLKPAEGWCGGCGTNTAVSKDGKTIYKQSTNSAITKYDLIAGKFVSGFNEEFDNITGIQLSPDERILLAGDDHFVYEYDTQSNSLIKKIPVAEGSKATELIVGKDSSSFFIAAESNVILQYNLHTGCLIKTFSGLTNDDKNRNLGYDPNDYWQSAISKYLRLKNPLLLMNDGTKLIKGKTGNEAKIWDVATGNPEYAFTGHESGVVSLDITKDNKTLATADVSGAIKIWDAKNKKQLVQLKGHGYPVLEVQFSPDEKELASSGWDGSLRIWNVATGDLKQLIDLDNKSAYSFSYTPDGLYLVVSKLGEPSLELIEPDSKSKVKSFIGHTSVVSSISFHPQDANTMLTSSWDGTIRVWDVATGMMKKKLSVEKGEVHEAIFTNDGKYIITAGTDRIIRVWDWQQSKIIKKLEGHKAEISNLSLDKPGKMLVSVSVDGSIKFWNLEKGEEFFEHIQLPGKEWMAITREGYFNGTMDGMKYIHFIKGTEVINTEQLIEKFYKPDLLPSIFKNQGGTGSLQKIEDILRASPIPEIKLTVVKMPDKAEAKLFIKLINNGGGIDEVKLLHNGKHISLNSSSRDFPSGKGEHTVITELITLVHGANIFEVTAFNRERIETKPVMQEVISESGEKGSICHILAIGIDKYINPTLELNYARDDAEAFSDVMLEKSKKLFKNIVLHPLYDEQATRENILDTLTALAETVQKNDVFIFYYAGHGSLTNDKFYFVPRECARIYDNNKLVKEAIEATIIQKKFRDIKALKQIIIMDACHSGGSVELLGMRGGLEEKAMAQLARSIGIHVLASAGSTQTAKEIQELGHGLFTYLLLKALNGEADGAPKDGKVTVYELKSYLDDQVPDLNKKYSGKPQYPYTFSRGHDFPIVIE